MIRRMPKAKRSPLRGSVTQNTTHLRMRSTEVTRGGFLLRLAALLGSALIVLTLVGWLWHIGWPQRQGERLINLGYIITQKLGFAIGNVVVEGRGHTGNDELIKILDYKIGAPLFAYDLEAAQSRLSKMPWVDSVIVRRQLPDKIVVGITERQPLARWQRQGKIVLIDNKGRELPEVDTAGFDQYPLVVGVGAPQKANSLLQKIASLPTIADNMIAATRVGERRWDLYLKPKVLVKLPEGDITPALNQLVILIDDKKILDRETAVIDLRLSDRLIIEPLTAPINRKDEEHPL